VAAAADRGALTVNAWLILDASVLALCASMYLGTGWSLVLFSFPVRPKLTPSNYYLQFVPQVQAATRFFTWMTTLMIGATVVVVVWDRSSWTVAFPAVLLAGVLLATALTIKFIFPYNKRMADGIADESELQSVLGKWVLLNWIRVGIWTVEWVAITAWFAVKLP
jgi:hypothetical protein